MREIDPNETPKKIANAIILRAMADAKLMIRRKIIVNGAANPKSLPFREKRQFDGDCWQKLADVNPRDVFSLIRFFDEDIKPLLKIGGFCVSTANIKRIKQEVFG